jgi:predicted component of type VI protein secretion system
MKVEITLKNGRKMRTTEAVARVLRNRRLVAGDYQTAVLVPAEAQEESPVVAEVTEDSPTDELDSLDADALHALAKERGVTVHHRAGADKVRAALREAQD